MGGDDPGDKQITCKAQYFVDSGSGFQAAWSDSEILLMGPGTQRGINGYHGVLGEFFLKIAESVLEIEGVNWFLQGAKYQKGGE